MELAPWTKVDALFEQALALPPDERTTFVENASEGDERLRHELTSLLAAFAQVRQTGADFLVEPVALDSSDAPTLAEGDRVGPWTVGALLGRGGMAEVYRAERADGTYTQTVALKLTEGRASFVRRFLTERRILASLQHPHIARLLDGGVTSDGRPYLAMEFVDGVPITEYAETHDLDVSARLRLFGQVSEAVAYAHRRLIVHRDLKPNNILVAEDDAGEPRVKLLDFGIAKLLEAPAGATVLTQANARPMTPAYAAPEQLEGGEITTAADVYALGVLLYELLAGARPYAATGETPTALLRAMDNDDLDPPSLAADRKGHPLPKRYAQDLDAIALKTLRYAPEDRYLSVEALAEDVARTLTGQPVTARQGTTGYRLRRFVRRHRVGVAATVAGVLALALGLGAALWQGRVAAEERDRAQREARTAEEVADFLVSLFSASNPAEAQGDTLTAFDMLARGETQANALEAEPEAQATLLRTIGQTYAELGQYAAAERLLARSLDVCAHTASERLRCEIETTAELSNLFSAQGNFETALRYAEEQLTLARTLENESGPETMRALDAMTYAYLEAHDYEQAERYGQEAYALQQRLPLAEHTPEVPGNLGSVYLYVGRPEYAEGLIREAVDLARSTLGSDHPSTITYTNNLAGAYGLMGDFEAAEPLMLEVHEANRRVRGPDHPDVVQSMNNLGMLYWKLGELRTAEEYFRDALGLARAELDRHHAHFVNPIVNLANLLVEQEHYEEAETLAREALAIRREVHGEDNPKTSNSLHALGNVLWARGNAAAAEPLYREALAIGQRHFPPTHPRTLVRLLKLADVRETLGDSTEAASLRARHDSLVAAGD